MSSSALTRTIPHPTTGEAVALTAPASKLADELAGIAKILDDVAAYRRILVEELARRADLKNARTVEVDGVKFEVNAPTTDVYELDDVREELGPLIESGDLDEEVYESLIRRAPAPKPPPPAIDKRRLAALLKSDNEAVVDALKRACRRQTNTRTVKVLARAVDSTATEETAP